MIKMIKRTLLFVLAASSCAFAQAPQAGGQVFFQSGTAVATAGVAPFDKGGAPVAGAPYSATITNESIQTLPDGNRIVQNYHGNDRARFAGPHAPGCSSAYDRQSFRRQRAPPRFHPRPRGADVLHLELDRQDRTENARSAAFAAPGRERRRRGRSRPSHHSNAGWRADGRSTPTRCRRQRRSSSKGMERRVTTRKAPRISARRRWPAFSPTECARRAPSPPVKSATIDPSRS